MQFTRPPQVRFITLCILTAALQVGAMDLPNAAWEEVGPGSATGGGISDNDGTSSAPSVAAAPGGALYVAWHDDSDVDGEYEIYVRRWDGSSWEEVGEGSATENGIGDNDGVSREPSVAIGLDGNPIVAWHDNSAGERNYEIHVRRWDGSAWAEVGTGSATGSGISGNDGYSTHPSLAIAPDGTPYVAWSDDSHHSGKPEIYVRRWDGNHWVEVGASSATEGGISDGGDIAVYPSIAIAPDGTPYVAWATYAEIYVRRWDASNWVEVGAGSATGGGISDTGGWSSVPALAVAPDGRPIVAWEDGNSGYRQIYVRRWDGAHWAEMGSGSATDGGISDSSTDSEFPAIAITPDGKPTVAWEDGGSGGRQIYVRRWHGGRWEEVGAGSAGDGGISDTTGESRVPSIAAAADGTRTIAWSDYSSGTRDVYVRQGPPELEIEPTSMTFMAEADGANPASRHLAVDTLGHAITWTATLSPAVAWLDAEPISGTTPVSITATAMISGLGIGRHTAQILIGADGAAIDSPQAVEVKLIVAEEIHELYLPLIVRGY
jgi:hypothetical protein